MNCFIDNKTIFRFVIAVILFIAFGSINNRSLASVGENPALNIASQDLESALVEFALLTNVELLYTHELVKEKQSHELRGKYEPVHALSILLQETGLKFEILNKSTFIIKQLKITTLSSEPFESKAVIKEVVVTGYGLQNQYAISHKRDSISIADFIVQDDIGRFPDFNIADSFRRLTGVAAVFDEDEGRFVVARGITSNYNYVSIDGIALATIDGFGETDRSVGLEAIPSSAVKRLEAVKTFTPDVDAGVIGSSLNLVSRSAFDSGASRFFLEASISNYSYNEIPGDNGLEGEIDNQPGGNITLSTSDIFGEEKQYGIVAALSYNVKQRDESKTIQEGHQYFDLNGNVLSGPTDPSWNGHVAPGEYRWFIYSNKVERYGSHIKLEYQPSENFHAFMTGYYYKQSEAETRNGHILSNFDKISNQDPTSGSFEDAQGIVSYDFFTLDRQNYGGSVFTRYNIDDLSSLTINAGYSYADFIDDSPSAIFETPRTSELSFDYDSSSFISRYNLHNPKYFISAKNYELKEFSFRQRKSDESIRDFKIDYFYNMGASEFGFGYKVGVEWRELIRERDNSSTIFNNSGLLLESLTENVSYIPDNRREPFIFLNMNRLRDVGGFQHNQDASTFGSFSEDFRHKESLSAAYIMAKYSNSDFHAVAGIRFEEVDISVRNPIFENNLFSQKRDRGKYTNALPSINIMYDINPAFKLRAAFSKTLGRPSSGNVADLETSNNNDAITKGNPDVDPSKVNNYDITFDYYADDGIFSLGFFYKDITGNIFTTATTNGNIDSPATIIQPMNTTSSSLRGIELSVIKNKLAFLPYPFDKLGFNGNITYMDGDLKFVDQAGKIGTLDRLIEQSDLISNAILFYNWNNKYEFRLIYGFQSSYTDVFFPDNPHLNREWKDYTQWDFHSRYNISNNWSLYFEARNITDNNRVLAETNAGLAADVEFGRSFFLGINYTL